MCDGRKFALAALAWLFLSGALTARSETQAAFGARGLLDPSPRGPADALAAAGRTMPAGLARPGATPDLHDALGAAGAQAQTAPRRGGNAEAAKRVNPVDSSPESIAAGRRAYTQYCANCHGSTGKGDGSGAAAGAAPADLTDAAWDYGSTDGEIFGVIHDGTSSEMGSYAERLKDADIWNIVNYIRTLAVKK